MSVGEAGFTRREDILQIASSNTPNLVRGGK